MIVRLQTKFHGITVGIGASCSALTVGLVELLKRVLA